MANDGQSGQVPTPPAGWYQDPTDSNGLRYWSGTQWTEHVAPAAPAAPTPTPEPTPEPTPPATPTSADEPWGTVQASGAGASQPWAAGQASGAGSYAYGTPAAAPWAAASASWDTGYGRVPGWDLDAAPLSFGEAISSGFRHAFHWSGRASRSAYWWFVLLEVIVTYPLALITGGLSSDQGSSASMGSSLTGLVSLIFLFPALAVLVRRLHDTDKSAWWILISFIPLVGSIVLLVFTVMEGNPGPNRYSLTPPAGAGQPPQAWG